MTIRSENLRDGERIAPSSHGPSAWKPIAVLLWLIACVTTWQLIVAVTAGMDWRLQVALGVGLQAIFTALERPVLRGRPNRISVVVLGIDALVNAGGVFPYAMRLGAAPTAQMISTATALQPQMTPWAAIGVSLLIGVLLAAAPEAVWRWRG
jgi:hypothetical protein